MHPHQLVYLRLHGVDSLEERRNCLAPILAQAHLHKLICDAGRAPRSTPLVIIHRLFCTVMLKPFSIS